LSLGAKERGFGADSCQKNKELIQKYLLQGFMPKIWRSYTKISCAKNLKMLYKNITTGAPLLTFCCFCFFDKAAYFSISDLEPMVSCATL